MNLKSKINRMIRRTNRVYIFPTKMGGYLIGLLFLMFLLSVGYSNNLLLVFTLFLFGFNLLWLIQTNSSMKALKLSSVEIPHGHMGQSITFKIRWQKHPEGQPQWELNFFTENDNIKTEAPYNADLVSQGEMVLNRRGEFHWSLVKITTTYPFGLYKAWTYCKLNQESLSYPKLGESLQTFNPEKIKQEGEKSESSAGPFDVRNLAPYQGEEFRRISWKHYARSGELLVKEGEDLSTSLWVHRLTIPESKEEKEKYLSEVATQMVHSFRHQQPFVFMTDTSTYGPESNEAHLHQCLKVLARC